MIWARLPPVLNVIHTPTTHDTLQRLQFWDHDSTRIRRPQHVDDQGFGIAEQFPEERAKLRPVKFNARNAGTPLPICTGPV